MAGSVDIVWNWTAVGRSPAHQKRFDKAFERFHASLELGVFLAKYLCLLFQVGYMMLLSIPTVLRRDTVPGGAGSKSSSAFRINGA